MNLDLDRIFAGGQVPGWLRAFAADPDQALHDLLLGRAELGHLTVAEPVELLLGWLRALDEGSGFPDHLDQALAAWIATYWGRSGLPEGADSASITTNAWLRVTELLVAASSLTRSGQALTRHMLADRRYLDSLAEGRSCDPQANAWLALATHQQDRSLLDRWWQLCELPPDQPWYRGHCGLAGLQALPPASAARAGGFPKELAEGLNRFGLALWRLQDEGWLDPQVAAEEFQDNLRLKLAAYPFPDRWLSFWRHVLRRDQRRGDIGGWVRGPLPQVTIEQRQNKAPRQIWATHNPAWAERNTAIAKRLRNGVAGSVEEAELLLAEQRGYFDRSGNSSDLVRAATRFSSAVRRNRPALALAWARLAKEIEPWNGYAWTTEGEALCAGGDLPGALAVYREAVGRFPDNAVARTGLAETLKAQGKLPEAEAEYRETQARFPDDAVARNGLAETLKAQNKFPEAEAEYRKTQARFPDNEYARTGLVEVLKVQDKLDEAAAEYRASKPQFPGSALPRDDLIADPKVENRGDHVAETDHSESPLSPPHHERAGVAPREASVESGLGRREIELIANDAFLVRRWARTARGYSPDLAPGYFRDRAAALLKQLLPAIDRDSIATGEAALLELDRGELEQARALLRRAVERFPGSARVRYALARAEREAPRGDPITPWRRLLRLDEHYAPIFFLGSGRTYLNRAANGDGRAEHEARDKLGRLALWVRQRTLIDADRAASDPQAEIPVPVSGSDTRGILPDGGPWRRKPSCSAWMLSKATMIWVIWVRSGSAPRPTAAGSTGWRKSSCCDMPGHERDRLAAADGAWCTGRIGDGHSAAYPWGWSGPPSIPQGLPNRGSLRREISCARNLCKVRRFLATLGMTAPGGRDDRGWFYHKILMKRITGKILFLLRREKW